MAAPKLPASSHPARAGAPAWIWPLLIAAAVIVAYSGTFGVPFIFDDIAAITQNPSLHRLSDSLTPPPDLSVSGRPLANFSLALNYAVGGTAVVGYHVLNLALHLASAGLIFGLIRRVARRVAPCPDATAVAALTALLWALHPVATATVTYVMQRTELLVSCCALTAVYAFVRGSEDSISTYRRLWWKILCVLACAAAMGAKEVAVVIPLLVLLVDRALSGAIPLSVLLRRRLTFYAALATTWLILAALLVMMPGRGSSAGLDSGVAWTDYALSQLAGLVTYVQLFAWPTPLIFDRGVALVPFGAATIAGGGLLLLLVGATVWTWNRRPLAAAALLWFILLLAPSSSVVPIATQILGEHRPYLALLGLGVLGTTSLLRVLGPRRLMIAGAGLALPLLVLTWQRNRDFASLESIWGDTARKAPSNARAHFNHGLALEVAGQTERALAAYMSCLTLSPTHAEAHAHVARIHQRAGRHREAAPYFESALREKPAAGLHNEAAVSLLILGDTEAAVRHFSASLRLSEAQPLVHYNLGLALQRLRRYPEALKHLETAARLAPQDLDATRAVTQLREFLRQ